MENTRQIVGWARGVTDEFGVYFCPIYNKINTENFKSAV